MPTVTRAEAAGLGILLAAALLLPGFGAAADGAAGETALGIACERDAISFLTEDGPARFTLELALTPEEQARGLMFRTDLAPDHGMLFVYDPPRRALFWMKNTPLSLDMIFIAEDGRVESVAAETVPYSTETIPSKGEVRAILEIVGGRAAETGIEAGVQAVHPAFLSAPEPHACPRP